MLNTIRAALSEAAQPYSDTRLHYCKVEAGLEGGRCTLTGAVLDAATLRAVLAALVARLPDVTFDASAVRVLRRGDAAPLVVATNLTGLYAGPSFLAEQVSQLLNGWPVEELLTEGRWAFVRLADGYLGWAYRPYLAEPGGERRHPPGLRAGQPAAVGARRSGRGVAALVSRTLGGTAVAVDGEQGAWAHVALAGGCAGWLPSAELRSLGALPQVPGGPPPPDHQRCPPLHRRPLPVGRLLGAGHRLFRPGPARASPGGRDAAARRRHAVRRGPAGRGALRAGRPALLRRAGRAAEHHPRRHQYGRLAHHPLIPLAQRRLRG